MAYVAFNQDMETTGIGAAIVGHAIDRQPAQIAVPRYSALEWSVIALARNDRPSTLRRPGRMALALGVLFGERANPRLADPKLEALRRIAVLSWRRGYSVAPAEVRAFIAAGYTPDQYELLLDSISMDQTARQRTIIRQN